MSYLIAIIAGIVLVLASCTFLSAGMLMEEGRDKYAGAGGIIAGILLTSGFVLALIA